MTSPPRSSPPSRARWVPRSPLHAAAVVSVVLAVIVAGSWAIGALSAEPTPSAAPEPMPTTTAPVPVWTDPPPAPVSPDAVAVAEAWVRALLVRPGQSREQWLARLDPLTSDEYLG